MSFKQHLLVLLSLFILSCNYYQPDNESMRKIPNHDNLTSSASLQLLLDALEKNETAETHLKLAFLFFKKVKLEQANHHIRAGLRLEQDPQDGDLYLYGEILEAQDSLNKADSIYRMILADNPQHWKTQRQLAKINLDNGKLLSAKEHIKQLEKLIPKEALLFDLKGRWAMAQYDTTHALQYLRKAIRIDPTYIPTYQHMSELYNSIELPYPALKWSRLGLKIARKNDTLFFQKGKAFLLLKMKDSAQVAFRSAYQINPKLYPASYEIAKIAYKRGQYKTALRYFNYSIEYGADQQYPKVYFYQGVCLQNTGKREKALKAYQTAIKADPSNLSARQYYYELKQLLQMQKAQRYADSLYKVGAQKPNIIKRKIKKTNTEKPKKILTEDNNIPSQDSTR